jgi:hypothetical protein
MRILRLPRVEDKTGLKHAEIYDRMREGDFPRPIPLGARARVAGGGGRRLDPPTNGQARPREGRLTTKKWPGGGVAEPRVQKRAIRQTLTTKSPTPRQATGAPLADSGHWRTLGDATAALLQRIGGSR